MRYLTDKFDKVEVEFKINLDQIYHVIMKCYLYSNSLTQTHIKC